MSPFPDEEDRADGAQDMIQMEGGRHERESRPRNSMYACKFPWFSDFQ